MTPKMIPKQPATAPKIALWTPKMAPKTPKIAARPQHSSQDGPQDQSLTPKKPSKNNWKIILLQNLRLWPIMLALGSPLGPKMAPKSVR